MSRNRDDLENALRALTKALEDLRLATAKAEAARKKVEAAEKSVRSAQMKQLAEAVDRAFRHPSPDRPRSFTIGPIDKE